MSMIFYEAPPTPADEAEREKAVVRSRALEAQGDAVLCDIAAEARRRFDAAMAVVSIVHGHYQHLVATDGLPTGIYSRRTSFCGHAVASGDDTFCVADLTQDTRFAGNPWVSGESGDNRYYAAAILRDDEGYALGTLCVTDTRIHAPLNAAEGRLLKSLAEGVMRRIGQLREREMAPA